MKATSTLHAVVVLAALVTFPLLVLAQPYSGPCLENCCCKVCSSPSNPAFPYGVTTVDIATNPVNPQVKDATCGFPVWSDGNWDKLNGDPATPPSTLWWTNIEVFGDLVPRAAPTTCDCCKLSVDTSCSEVGFPATRPKEFHVTSGKPIEYKPLQMVFKKGVALTQGDYIELRNDTFCGYTHPHPVLRSNASQLAITIDPSNTDFTINTWSIPRLPSDSCYRVCYYHSTLTTPTWYDLGTLTVYGDYNPSSTVAYALGVLDVPLEGNEVTLTFKGGDLLSVFEDAVELRTDTNCGSGGEATSTVIATNGILQVTDGHKWCEPEVVPGITALRPLRYITPQYADCPTADRLYQERVKWTLTLPATAAYTVCYRRGATWSTPSSLDVIGTLSVTAQLTQLNGLLALKASTDGGNTWTRDTDWAGSDVCLFYGVRCRGTQVVSIVLSRNNLEGPLPVGFFTAAYFNTLEYLALDENHISGSVPHEIGAFRNLKYLNLGVNQISGTLPPSLQRTSLLHLYAPMNQLDGTVPKDLAEMRQLWTEYNTQMTPFVATTAPSFCPVDPLECSEKGSTDLGVYQCGYASITEAECVARGCCFNVQAALFFGGTACFTKRSAFITTNPACTNSIECQTQIAPAQ